jgi:hypothetical protein
VASVDELQSLVENIKKFRAGIPQAQKDARKSLWLARGATFFALVAVVSNFVMLDLPLVTFVAVFCSSAALLQGVQLLIAAESWRVKLQKLVDDSATDLKKYTALLEYERAQATTDERPTP